MSHVSGYDGISGYMLLNCLSDKVMRCLKDLYIMILKYGVIPDNFNVTLIRPILKDRKS